MTFRALSELGVLDEYDFIRRVIMAGYYREMGSLYPKVGEARWADPDGKGRRWIWASGTDVINPLGFLNFPDFPIPITDARFATGKPDA